MSNLPVIIIGAGMAGLAAAQRLAAANIPALLLDKGRGVGGRMATRRAGEAVFDHGAQFFSAKTPGFQAWVTTARQAGVLKEWYPRSTGDQTPSHPRWIGAQGMNALPKMMAENCTVQKSVKVIRIAPRPGGWQISAEDETQYSARALLVTIPAPQALELLSNSGMDFPGMPLRQIAYHPCLALMATLDRPSAIPAPGGWAPENTPIAWLADNFQKGISPQPTLTIHATPAFSRLHLDGDLTAAGQLLLEAAAPWLGTARVLEWHIHRWRYSLAYERYAEPYWQAAAVSPLLFGGDGFGIGNIEGAFLSGWSMAERLLDILEA